MGGMHAIGNMSRRGGISAVEWSPDNVSDSVSPKEFILMQQPQPTKLITASEDDGLPVVMMWDLRNSRAPEKVKTNYLLIIWIANAFFS